MSGVRKKSAMTRTEASIVFSLLPDKRPALEQFISKLAGEYQAEHDRSHSLVSRESWFLQPTPQGDLVIVYLETPDPTELFADMAVSSDAFIVWFRAQVFDLTGLDLTMLPPFSLPTRILHRVRETTTDVAAGSFAASDH
jgi:hypothetical protein